MNTIQFWLDNQLYKSQSDEFSVVDVLDYYEKEYNLNNTIPESVLLYFDDANHRMDLGYQKTYKNIFIPLRYQVFLRNKDPDEIVARWICLMQHTYFNPIDKNYHDAIIDYLKSRKEEVRMELDAYLHDLIELNDNPSNVVNFLKLPHVDFNTYLYLSPRFQEFFAGMQRGKSADKIMLNFLKGDEYWRVRVGLGFDKPQNKEQELWLVQYQMIGYHLWDEVEVITSQELNIYV